MSDDEHDEAPCVLLWINTGGKIDSKGVPIFGSSARGRLNCSEPHNCDSCPLMQNELAMYPREHIFWVCSNCVDELVRLMKSKGRSFVLPAHYTEGRCQYPACPRIGEGAAGYFPSLLQLFIGDIS